MAAGGSVRVVCACVVCVCLHLWKSCLQWGVESISIGERLAICFPLLRE